jgi:hypothetical protein
MATQPHTFRGRHLLTDPVCRRTLIASVCWLAIYAVLTAIGQGSPGTMLFVGDILYLVPIIASVVAAAVAAHRLTGRHRRLWLTLAVAYTAQLGGESVWAAYDYLSTDGPPQPSIADAGYLIASAVTVVAVLIGFGGMGRLRRLRGLLDAALIVISLGGLGWQVLLRPQLSDNLALPDLVSLAYPMLDITLLCCLSIVGIAGHRRVPLAVRLVGVAAAVNAVSDMTYTYQSIFTGYESGSWLDFMFEAGAVVAFLSAMVAMRLPEPPAQRRSFDRGLTLLPHPHLDSGHVHPGDLQKVDLRNGRQPDAGHGRCAVPDRAAAPIPLRHRPGRAGRATPAGPAQAGTTCRDRRADRALQPPLPHRGPRPRRRVGVRIDTRLIGTNMRNDPDLGTQARHAH